MKGEKVWQTTLEEPLMISESCLMSWLVLVMILLVCCCIECLKNSEKSFKKHSFCPLFLRRNHTYGIIRTTTYMGFTQLASRKFANWLGKSSPWWWNIRGFPTNVSWTEETYWMSDGTSARHQRKKLNLQVQPGRPRSFTDVFKRPLPDSAEQAHVILRLYVTAESEFGLTVW